jgi:hypothetical protein
VVRQTVTFAVERTLKGDPAEAEVPVTFFQLESGPGLPEYRIRYEEIPWGEPVLAFLRKEQEGFFLLESHAEGGSVIPISEVVPESVVQGLTPSRKVVIQLLWKIDEAEVGLQKIALAPLCELGYVIAEIPNPFAKIPPLEGEDPGLHGFRKFIDQEAVPDLLALTVQDNEETRAVAWATLGYLQQPFAIPPLRVLAERGQGSEVVLQEYATERAVPWLLPLLDSEKDEIRQSAAYALKHIASPLSLPAMLKALEDPLQTMRYSAVCALSAITGEGVFPSIPRFQEEEEQLLNFWKGWAQQHPELASGEQILPQKERQR